MPHPTQSWLARATSPRSIGFLFVLSGVMLNSGSLEQLFDPDGEIANVTWRAVIFAGQAGLVLAGAWLVLRNPSRSGRPWPATICSGLVLASATAVLVGLYGTSLSLGWLHPRIKPFSELCTWLPANAPFLSPTRLRTTSAELARVQSQRGAEDQQITLHQQMGRYLLRFGKIEEAIQHFHSAYTLALAQEKAQPIINDLRSWLGIAHLRSGEVQHCLHLHNPERCLFPISEAGIWDDPQRAHQAIAYFTASLDAQPADARVRWLLNIAHMTAGSYPDGLPAEVRISPSLIESSTEAQQQVGRFRDIAPALGTDAFNLVGGAVVDDFDNDGFLDILTSTWHPCEPLLYYHNNGDGTFANWSAKANLTAQLGGFNLVQADYNNDGLLDLFVLRGAWMGRQYGRQRNSLLRQNPDGTFTDVTEAAGLGQTAYPCLSAAWADYDNDGDVDLYIGNEDFPSELFRNNGDGTFTDVAQRAGVQNWHNVKGVAWGDYDNDGDPDLYVSNLGGPNRLYQNNGNGTFTDVAAELGVAIRPQSKGATFATWFWDVDNDGWLDLFVAGYGAGVDDVAADYLGLPASGERLHLYRNDGSGHFTDATKAMNLYAIRTPMGANYGDIDNDGWLDFYLGTGAPSFDHLVPNVLYRNQAGKHFVDVTTAAGVGHLQKGHGIAFGDLDNDGDQDIYHQIGGAFPDDRFHNALFENPGGPNRWITLKLVGVESNRSAIGTRLTVVVETAEGERSIYGVVSSGGSFGASSLQQEMGLGAASRIKALQLYWPASDTHQHFNDVALNQFIEITEGVQTYQRLDRKPVLLATVDPYGDTHHHK